MVVYAVPCCAGSRVLAYMLLQWSQARDLTLCCWSMSRIPSTITQYRICCKGILSVVTDGTAHVHIRIPVPHAICIIWLSLVPAHLKPVVTQCYRSICWYIVLAWNVYFTLLLLDIGICLHWLCSHLVVRSVSQLIVTEIVGVCVSDFHSCTSATLLASKHWNNWYAAVWKGADIYVFSSDRCHHSYSTCLSLTQHVKSWDY